MRFRVRATGRGPSIRKDTEPWLQDKQLEVRKEFGNFALLKFLEITTYIAGWCNGNTDDFDSSVEGSNPSPAATSDASVMGACKTFS